MVQRWTIEISQLQLAAVHQRGRLHPCRCAQFIPWSRQLTWDSPVASNGGRHPCFLVEQVHFPVVAQRQVHGPNYSFDHGHSTVAQHGGRCPCCAVPQFSSAAVEETAELPQLQLVVLVLGQGRSHARCVQRHLSGGSECSQLRRLAQLQCSDGVSWDFLKGPVH